MQKYQVWWSVLIIQAQGRQRQEGRWGSLTSQSKLIGELWTNGRCYLKEGI